jgi:hypothetical protein
VSQVLLHTHGQDEQGVLVGQVDELSDGGCFAVDLLLEELFPGGACSSGAASQVSDTPGQYLLPKAMGNA